MLFHMKVEFIAFLYYDICLSAEWGMLSFFLCIYFGLTTNQTIHSLNSLALFYGYVRPSRQISGLCPKGYQSSSKGRHTLYIHKPQPLDEYIFTT